MISIGNKSAFIALIFLFSLVLLGVSPAGELGKVLSLDSSAALLVGLVASLLGAIVYRSIKPQSPSSYSFNFRKRGQPDAFETTLFRWKKYYISVDRNMTSEALEWPNLFFRIFIFSIFLIMSVLVFSHREAMLIRDLTQQEWLSGGPFCQDNEEKREEAESRPECQLLLRAYKLGYADDLGDCGEFFDGPPKWCELRRKDEPYLHFAWRRLTESGNSFLNIVSKWNVSDLSERVKKDKERFKPLARLRAAEVSGGDRAKHIILLNLPEPEGWLWTWFRENLMPSRCLVTESNHPNRLPDPQNTKDLSANIRMASGHLLFDFNYNQVVSSCKEYHFIWNQDPQICSNMETDTEATLKELGYLDDFQFIISRYKNKKMAYPNKPSLKPENVLSVSCLNYGSSLMQQRVASLSLEGESFPLKIVDSPEFNYEVGDSIKSFSLASQLAGLRFYYNRLYSRSGLSAQATGVPLELLAQPHYRLTRLSFLEDVDVFLNTHWVHNRKDFLEVYPYYIHLAHYVNTFRKQYTDSRGRL